MSSRNGRWVSGTSSEPIRWPRNRSTPLPPQPVHGPLWAFLVCLIGVTGVTSGHKEMGMAGTLLPRTVGELAREADLIIRGKVEALLPSEPTLGQPTTTVVIAVTQSWKATTRAEVRVIQPVGTFEGMSHQVPGLPSFQIGEEVILFLVQLGPGRYEVLHGKQGKLSIVADPQSQRLMVQDVTGSLADLTEVLTQF